VTVTEAGTVLLREARALIAQHDRVLAAVTGQVLVPAREPARVLGQGIALVARQLAA
jgi:DNA-binding transcriptional LysR family regulator